MFESNTLETYLTEQDLPSSHKNREERESCLREAAQREKREEAVLLGQLYRAGCRENKPDTGEDRRRQRMRSQKIRTECQS